MPDCSAAKASSTPPVTPSKLSASVARVASIRCVRATVASTRSARSVTRSSNSSVGWVGLAPTRSASSATASCSRAAYWSSSWCGSGVSFAGVVGCGIGRSLIDALWSDHCSASALASSRRVMQPSSTRIWPSGCPVFSCSTVAFARSFSEANPSSSRISPIWRPFIAGTALMRKHPAPGSVNRSRPAVAQRRQGIPHGSYRDRRGTPRSPVPGTKDRL